jgi:hypothetical protein
VTQRAGQPAPRPAAQAIVVRDCPPGYAPFGLGKTWGLALTPLLRTMQEVLRDGTLYEYGARHPRARALSGRATAWAVPLPDAVTQVVVRHGWHGGLLRHLTGDRFLAPTRAPRELRTALTLRERGVPTPEIVAFAIYPAGPLLRRSDVASREVPRARDLAITLLGPPERAAKEAALDATATLLAQLAAAGARHADLNLKNVLLEPATGGGFTAWVLDVDRVRFFSPGDARVATLNHARLARSARKWARLYGADVTEDDLASLARRVEARAR